MKIATTQPAVEARRSTRYSALQVLADFDNILARGEIEGRKASQAS